MAREHFVALCSGAFVFAGGFGFGWFTTPETAEFKLAKIRSGVDFSIPVSTLPPDVDVFECIIVSWEPVPEFQCPPRPPLPEGRTPTVPTS